MFENPKDRAKIKNIFKNISTIETELNPKFKNILKENGPIALYVATKDQDNIMWLFDKEEINRMLGGESSLEELTEQLLPEEKDKKEGVVLVIFKKVGPIYAIRLEKAILEEVFL